MKKIIFIGSVLILSLAIVGCNKVEQQAKIVSADDIENIRELRDIAKEDSGFKKVKNNEFYLCDLDSDGQDEILVSNYKLKEESICFYIDGYNPATNIFFEIADKEDNLSYELMIYQSNLCILEKSYNEFYESDIESIYVPVMAEDNIIIEEINKRKENKILEHLMAKEATQDDGLDIETIREEINNFIDFNYLSGRLFLADLNYDGVYEIYSSSLYSINDTTYFIECYNPVNKEYSLIYDLHHKDYHIVLFDDKLYAVVIPKDIDSNKNEPAVERLIYTNLGIMSSFASEETKEKVLNNTRIDEKQKEMINTRVELYVKKSNMQPRMITINDMKYIVKEYNDIVKNRRNNDCTNKMYRADLDEDGKWELYITRIEGRDLITSYIECYNPINGEISEVNDRGKIEYGYFFYEDDLYVEATSRDGDFNEQYTKNRRIYKPYLFNGVLDLSKISEELEKEMLHQLYPYKKVN